ncbi:MULTISPECIES: major capsid protein [unclassified Pseudoclavibacter]|uniref:major capsid protein n=1 Tax=unclassified Pseudoclavibacter TaxID=2615177 RepID=UPI001BAC670F|nr:major capsid protein [Pseudoclavibacter sp. Marseille-Q4354]MBS3177748.1 major capsid protein [Pseudoclavibacter sp. Marseille-Q4354]
MTINLAHATAVQLTAAARAAAAAVTAQLPLAQYLPDRSNATLSFEFSDNSASIDTAEYRAYDTEAPYGNSEGKMTRSGKLPPLSRKRRVTEYDELMLNGRSTTALYDKLVDHAEHLGRGIALRLEFARAEAFRKGRLTLSENGLRADINYGRKAERTVKLTGTARWGQSAAKPLEDLIKWSQLGVNDADTITPTRLVMTADVLEFLSKNAEIIGAALSRSDNLPGRISYDAVKSVLAQYGFITVTDVATLYAGFNVGAILPAGTVLLLPQPSINGLGGLGSTDYGVPTEALQPNYGISGPEQPGIFAGAFGRTDPEGLDVLGTAIALPVLTGANSTFAAEVF